MTFSNVAGALAFGQSFLWSVSSTLSILTSVNLNILQPILTHLEVAESQHVGKMLIVD